MHLATEAAAEAAARAVAQAASSHAAAAAAADVEQQVFEQILAHNNASAAAAAREAANGGGGGGGSALPTLAKGPAPLTQYQVPASFESQGALDDGFASALKDAGDVLAGGGGDGAAKPVVGTEEWHRIRRDNHKEGMAV
jgi:hypothetical protein